MAIALFNVLRQVTPRPGVQLRQAEVVNWALFAQLRAPPGQLAEEIVIAAADLDPGRTVGFEPHALQPSGAFSKQPRGPGGIERGFVGQGRRRPPALKSRPTCRARLRNRLRRRGVKTKRQLAGQNR